MCYYDYSSTNYYKEWIFLIVGAILGLVLSLCWKYLSDYLFQISVLEQRLGEYKITLKNDKPFSTKMERACIKEVKGRKMTFVIEINNDEKNGNAYGEIEFISKNYGRGFYKHRNSNLYGFYEFILLPENKICALRKYTTDETTDKVKISETRETSFIWEKQSSKCDWC